MLVVKNPPIHAGDSGDLGRIPGWRRSPGGGNNPTPGLLPGEAHGQRSLVGYGPWGHKEWDTAERFHAGSKNLEHMKKLQTSSRRSPPKKWNKRSRISHILCISLFFSALPEPHNEIPSWDQICCQHDRFLHPVCANCRHPAVWGPR